MMPAATSDSTDSPGPGPRTAPGHSLAAADLPDQLESRLDLRVVSVRQPGAVPTDASRQQWRRLLGDPATYQRATVLKGSHGPVPLLAPDGWVGVVAPPGVAGLSQRIVIKVRRLRGVGAGLRAFAGLSASDRHARAALRLVLAMVPTARVQCLALLRVNGRLCELLAMEHLAGTTLLEVMARSTAGARGRAGGMTTRDEHAVAAAVGEQVMGMLDRGIFNRDHKPSNLIVLETPRSVGVASARTIAVIDCGGVRRCVGPSLDHLSRMLASLVIEPSGTRDAATGRPVLARRALLMRALRAALSSEPDRREQVREVWRAVAARVRAHGDPTPRVNPLTAAGG